MFINHLFSPFSICVSTVSLFLASLCPSIYGAACLPLPVHSWRCLPPFARPFLALLASLFPSIYGVACLPLPVHLWRCLPPIARPFLALLASLCPSIYCVACLPLPVHFWRCLPPFARPFMALLALRYSVNRNCSLLYKKVRVNIFCKKKLSYNILKI